MVNYCIDSRLLTTYTVHELYHSHNAFPFQSQSKLPLREPRCLIDKRLLGSGIPAVVKSRGAMVGPPWTNDCHTIKKRKKQSSSREPKIWYRNIPTMYQVISCIPRSDLLLNLDICKFNYSTELFTVDLDVLLC